jgi:MFS family permease
MAISTGARQRSFYGWTALAGAMLVSFGMVGSTITSYGVFLPVMCQQLEWSRSALSGPYTAFWAVVGVLGPVAGISISRFGSRKNILFGNLAIVLGLLAMSLTSEVWQVYLFFSIMAGTGQGFGTFIAMTTVANNWFVRRRSLAMGLLTAAGGIGGLTLPPFISRLISSVGWQLAWVYLASIHAVLVLFVAGLLIRNKPEDLGQLPDGGDNEGDKEPGAGDPALRRVYQTAVDWRVSNALRTPALWLIVTFVSAHLFSLNFITLHQVAYLQDLGFSPMTAATTVGVLAGMSVIGQLLCGTLGIRFEGRYLTAACLVSFAIGLTILMNARALPFVYLHTVLSGIGYGGLIMLQPVLIGAYYGRAHYSRIIGWTVPVTTIFSSVSPVLAGLIYDAVGSYTPSFIISIILLGVGLVCALLARPPRPPAEMEAAF